ncbi:RNA polymerase sigma factor [Sphingobium yanoikuyae]|uniref:RNA polymerase sigma factor n=1 Tax=Sphingobium yanoikuyae TaxID=13690 RepID=A0A9X7YGI7_SPHYA|nr:RNA polymerase sigma factor [Sphingobium yanoikuyae]MDH2135190.1 RNA polymerase sigma factor [Sphingobium yanoikuyae]MDH2170528.1 RNA polymerase sigma factor [Sphingobium yanoikuyae]QNG49722.1 RNA polymerase sigma factor [Sphingobium yanoikuyae]
MLARAGRSDAFVAIMRRHRDAIYRLICVHVGDADEALDLTQECFAAAYRALAQFEVDHSLRGWLARIAINKCRDWGRRRAVRRFFSFALPLTEALAETLEDPAPGPYRDLAGREEARRLWAAVALLPPNMKEPLLLSAIEGLSHAEVGAILAISEKAVESRLYRARRKLEALLGDELTDGCV